MTSALHSLSKSGRNRTPVRRTMIARFAALLFIAPVWAESPLPQDTQTLIDQYQAARQRVSEEAGADRSKIEKGYLDALRRYEATLQQAGDLEALLEARKQRALYEDSRAFGETEDAELKKLRAILRESLAPIGEKEAKELRELFETYASALAEMMQRETRSGNLESALAIKELLERAKAEAPSEAPSPPAGAAPSTAPPSVAEVPSGDASGFEPFPTLRGDRIAGDPFELEEWPVNGVVPVANYRLGERFSPKWPAKTKPTVLFSEGTTIKGTDDRAELMLGQAATTVSIGVRFEDLKLRGDLGTKFYFRNCDFRDAEVGKGGAWGSGKRPMTAWHIRECRIEGGFLVEWSPMHTGIHAWKSQFERVEFSLRYDQPDTPADAAAKGWSLFRDCHLRKCEIPVGVLAFMENCTFEDCRFIDDPAPSTFPSPVARTLYIEGGVWAVGELPKNLTLVRKPIDEKP